MTTQISVIIPVFKEAKTIQRTLDHLLHLNSFEPPEIIIVEGEAGRSTLGTIPQDGIIKITGPIGRGAQMNLGAAISTGNILLFLHADTLLPENALKTILAATTPKNVMGGAFNLSIDSNGLPFRVIEAFVRIRTRIIGMPYGDQAIFMKRKYFYEVGGYPNIPIMEDVALIRKIKKRGQKFIIIPASVTTSARRWKTEGLLYCTLRNWVLLFLYSVGVSPEKIAKYYPLNRNGG